MTQRLFTTILILFGMQAMLHAAEPKTVKTKLVVDVGSYAGQYSRATVSVNGTKARSIASVSSVSWNLPIGQHSFKVIFYDLKRKVKGKDKLYKETQSFVAPVAATKSDAPLTIKLNVKNSP